jgi:hypothetical protein
MLFPNKKFYKYGIIDSWRKNMLWDCRKLHEILGVSGEDFFEIDENIWKQNGSSGCDGIMNPFYGLKHTEETKQILREMTLKLCEDPIFRQSRANYGEKNGMYGTKRNGQLNPMYGKKQSDITKEIISKKAKERYANGFVNPKKGKKLTTEQKQSISIKNSKIFKIRHPNGKIIEIKNLTKYSEDNNLNYIMMSRVSRGLSKSHKGYTKP